MPQSYLVIALCSLLKNKLFSLTIAILLLHLPAFAQPVDLWPAEMLVYSSEDSTWQEGTELYSSGNLLAKGPLTKSGEETVIVAADNFREAKHTVYARTGTWTVYYDSGVSVIRGQGTYVDGKRQGPWTMFDPQGKVRREYIFENDVIRRQTDIDAAGNRNVVLDRSDGTLLFLKYELLFFLLGLGPILLIRTASNIIVWNKVHLTKYIPGVHMYQKGGMAVNAFATVIFWWIIKDDDTPAVRRYKKIGNWVSATSIIIFGWFVWAVSRWYENY